MNDSLQSLERAFHILERIALVPNNPHRVQDVAKESQLSVQAASKILRTLTTLGYLENVGRKQGYILGPKIIWLGASYCDTDDLRRIGERCLQEYFERFGEYVDVCAMRGNLRRIVYRIRSKEADPKLAYFYPLETELLDSLTGLMMAATLPEDRQRKLYQRTGCPKFWPCEDEEDFVAKMKELAANPVKVLKDPHSPRTIIAVRFTLRSGERASLGSFMPTERYKPEMLEMLQEIASRMVQRY